MASRGGHTTNHDPTPEEIAEVCERIRDGWTRRERLMRLVVHQKRVEFDREPVRFARFDYGELGR